MRASVMTPMVFCASFVPCAREIRAAEPTCPTRKPWPRTSLAADLVIRYTEYVPIAAMRPAITGESTAGIRTLDTMPCHFTAPAPAAAMVDPTTPPISAWDELDGIPRYHVARFHAMPPASPANTTVSVTWVLLTKPLAMVAATLNDRKAPT